MQCRIRVHVTSTPALVCVCVCEKKRYPAECKLCIDTQVHAPIRYVCIGMHRTVKCSAG